MTTKPTIIMISGTGPGAGKSTFADALVTHLGSAVRCSFASPLKALCSSVFNWDGKKDEKGRRLLQEIGCAARHYDVNIWADRAVKYVRANYSNNYKFVIFDDARFWNEAQVFKDEGYEVIQFHICRYFDEPPVGIMHESEGYIPNPPFTNIENGSLEGFTASAKSMAHEILKAKDMTE